MSDAEHVPSWVPEIAPGVRADVYPVEPPRPSRVPFSDAPPELVLDRQAVTSGYSERRLPYEFASCLPTPLASITPPSLSSAVPGAAPPPFTPASGNGLSASDLSKLRTGIAVLRRSRPTKLQRVEQHLFLPPNHPNDADSDTHNSHTHTPSLSSNKPFPLQKPSGSSSLDEWFNKLSSGSNFNTSELSRSVPLGPAIGRATGKVIEMMATRSVPTQRAAWYIRIAVLNECVKQIRPDRPPPSATAFWTRQLSALLKTEMEAIRSRKANTLGSMDRVAFWDYVLDLARWQADEGLLDCKQWLPRVAVVLRSELAVSQSFSSPGTKIAVSAARRFLPEFLISASTTLTLLESLLPGANAIVKAWRGAPAVTGKTSAGGTAQGQGKRDPKSSSRKASVKRQPFTPNICHREVTMLLSAAVRVLDDTVVGNPESETRMSDLERFVRRGFGIVMKTRNRDAAEAAKTGERKSLSPGATTTPSKRNEWYSSLHTSIREMELLPGHGEVSKVVDAIRETYEARGGLKDAVKHVCSWVIEGPVNDTAEAICVGCAVMLDLGRNSCTTAEGVHQIEVPRRTFNHELHRVTSENSDPCFVPPLQREIWNFLKAFSRDKKATSLSGGDRIVRFIAQLCRTQQLSLRVLVRDISRLSSQGHPGTGYLVKCLALLPDPAERHEEFKASAPLQNLDCRRPLLRKFGYLANSRPKYGNACGTLVQAILAGDLATMTKETDRLLSAGEITPLLCTTETVRSRFSAAWLEKANNIEGKVHTMASFMHFVQEPYQLMEWLLGNLSDIVESEGHWKGVASNQKRQNELMAVIMSITENVSRYIAASGLVEEVFLILEKAWFCPWVNGEVQSGILLCCAAFCKLFGGGSVGGASSWTRLSLRHLQKRTDAAAAAKTHVFALACLRGKIERNASGKLNVADFVAMAKQEIVLAQGEDALSAIAVNRQGDIDVAEAKASFSNPDRHFPMQVYLAKGFTASDILASVFVPVLVEALSESNEGTTECRFSKLVVSVLRLLNEHKNDIRLQGIRPLILVEFIALIIAGCLSGHTNTGVSLEVLVKMKWLWKILAPRGSASFAGNLRDRVEFHCSTNESVDTQVMLASLFNMVIRFLGASERDEYGIASSVGKEPLGMIEMQVALLAAYRKECEVEQDFAGRLGEAAVALTCPDSARTLAACAVHSCTDTDWKQAVAGVMGHSAATAMGTSIGCFSGAMNEEMSVSDAGIKERTEWHQADEARCGVLECVVESLSQEVGGQVETLLFDQLLRIRTCMASAVKSDGMYNCLPQDACKLSRALHSRFQCILLSQRTPSSKEIWSKRAVDVADLLGSSAQFLQRKAILGGANVLALCLKSFLECERRCNDESGSTFGPIVSPTLDAVQDEELKKQLMTRLQLILRWLEPADEKSITKLIDGRSGYGVQRSTAVNAFTASGGDVDNWLLLEGYGRGNDEEAVVAPTAFGMQGGGGGKLRDATGVVQLKRTYSTFASVAV